MVRKKRARFQWWALMIVVPIFLVASVYEFYVHVLRPVFAALMLDGSVQAVITHAEQLRNGRRGSSLLSNCGVQYEFFVDGLRYEGPQGIEASLSGYCPPVGSSLNIRYAVDNPAYNVWGVEYNFSSLNLLWTAVTFVFVCTLVFGVISFARWARNSKASASTSSGTAVETF